MRNRMSEQQNFQDYLKGALAGTFIGRGSRPLDQGDPFTDSRWAPVLELNVPLQLPVKGTVDLCVRLRNIGGKSGQGMLLLRGEDVRSGMTYEFEAPVRSDLGEKGCLFVFSWKAPASATRIEWSATVQMEGRMGISIPACCAATIVTASTSESTNRQV
ncbi:hypothetical protein EDC39_10498 [Geothermobacter ehrlichii]|uniref:Uncharacterized protein n=1 Tax=Geothermobacter ehrlichii TaxID=213224 RepID=A0A5D3WLG8_9BACT|nr:hypothetical protein [Geothermobacter ehrlichii]TYO98974.1 hypothetical protein EDC39_10498 [Geothermobacter ehrlichii]